MPDFTEEKKQEGSEWKAFHITTNMTILGPTPMWVVRTKDKRYLRLTGGKTGLVVTDRRMATRFDSRTWAESWATFMPSGMKPKVVRVLTKAEKEIEKAREKSAYVVKYAMPEPKAEPKEEAKEQPKPPMDKNTEVRGRIYVRTNTKELGGGFSTWVTGIPAVGTGATKGEAVISLANQFADFIDHRDQWNRELDTKVDNLIKEKEALGAELRAQASKK